MVSFLLPTIFSFIGALCLGVTAVFLKIAHVDSVYYGLLVRAMASAPLMLLLTYILLGKGFFSDYLNPSVWIPTFFASITLVIADILIMTILKRKPVGVIAPLMSIFPLFTSLLLIITGFQVISLEIIGLTLVIIIGVMFVTYDSEAIGEISGFDTEALGFGISIAFFLGLTNFFDIIVIQQDNNIGGLAFTSLKFTILLLISLVLFLSVDNQSWSTYQLNRKSTTYLVLAGISAWGLGSFLIYTSYEFGEAGIVNAIIGTNPVFAVIISLFAGMENINKFKLFGMSLCVVASIGIVNI